MPPAPPSLHDMTPIMDEDGLVVSVMDAVNVTVFPDVKFAGFGVTLVIVVSSVLVDICDAPELLW